MPARLDPPLVSRLFDVLKRLLEPLPESFILPAHTILDPTPRRPAQAIRGPAVLLAEPTVPGPDDPREHPVLLEIHVKVLVEFLTASSWEVSFDYFKTVVYTIRTTQIAQHGSGQPATPTEEDKAAMVALRLLGFFWVDGQKLGLVIQEICSSFLHFRRIFQSTIAVVLPMVITGWLDRYPHEFVQQHTQHKRLDGGADTLFDMAHALGDGGRRKGALVALQTTLLFLLPDVFEVASNLREAKSNSIIKKTTFLEGLRKALRNRNEQAAYCLVSLLHASRHFEPEDDAALVSFALDIQDEVKDAIFRRPPANTESLTFEQDLLTATFVSLAQLNPSTSSEPLVDACLAPSAPRAFTIAMAQGCSFLARQADARKYDGLFSTTAPFMLNQLQVCSAISLRWKALAWQLTPSDDCRHFRRRKLGQRIAGCQRNSHCLQYHRLSRLVATVTSRGRHCRD